MPVVYMLALLGLYVFVVFVVMLGFWSLFALVLHRLGLPFPTLAVVTLAAVTALPLAWLLLPVFG